MEYMHYRPKSIVTKLHKTGILLDRGRKVAETIPIARGPILTSPTERHRDDSIKASPKPIPDRLENTGFRRPRTTPDRCSICFFGFLGGPVRLKWQIWVFPGYRPENLKLVYTSSQRACSILKSYQCPCRDS